MRRCTAAVTGKGRHDLVKDIQLASRVIRGERSQVFHVGVVVAPRAIRSAAGVSEHHSTHSNAHVFFVPFLMTEIQMALLSAARPASPPIPEEDRRTSRGGGRAARSVSSWSSFRCLRFQSLGSFRSWARLPLRLLRRVSAAYHSVGGAARAREAQRASSAVWRWRWR